MNLTAIVVRGPCLSRDIHERSFTIPRIRGPLSTIYVRYRYHVVTMLLTVRTITIRAGLFREVPSNPRKSKLRPETVANCQDTPFHLFMRAFHERLMLVLAAPPIVR